MRFGKKLLAAIERGEWVRIRSWPKGYKIRKDGDGCFVNEKGYEGKLNATNILSKDWVIVRRKKSKAPVTDDPRYEPLSTMPVVGDKVVYPADCGKYPPRTVNKILEAEATSTYRWRILKRRDIALLKSGAGWRILKRRDVFTDPKPGDVIGKADATVEVRFADAEAVMLRWNSGPPTATSRETWAAYAASGWTVRKLGS